jgi:hypothetical protein
MSWASSQCRRFRDSTMISLKALSLCWHALPPVIDKLRHCLPHEALIRLALSRQDGLLGYDYPGVRATINNWIRCSSRRR